MRGSFRLRAMAFEDFLNTVSLGKSRYGGRSPDVGRVDGYWAHKMDISASLIISVHNGESTLPDVFHSLESQREKELLKRVIIIDDCSTDGSARIIDEFKSRSPYEIVCIKHEQPHGLAANYNEGIRLGDTGFVILMHQDIVLLDPDSLLKITSPLVSDETAIAACPVIIHPADVWDTYGFWQKCLFSRFVGKKISRLDGKFDCYRKRNLIETVGYFDEETFTTAGEDGDMRARLRMAGARIAEAQVDVVHVHQVGRDFGLRQLIRKEAQLQEANGAILRKYGFRNQVDFLQTYFRQLLVLGLLLPGIRYFAIVLIAAYSFFYTRQMYEKEYRDKRILFLPAVNALLLLVDLVMSAKGYLTGKQRIA